MAAEARTPSQALAAAVRECRRTRKGWSQERLSRELDGLGVRLHPTAIVKIERGTRGVSVDEAFALALALQVAPVHLLVPLDDDAPVAVTPNTSAPAAEVRDWVRGRRELDDDAERWYFFWVPASEFPPPRTWRPACRPRRCEGMCSCCPVC
ncbi:MAG: helix-turn-helix domain-containing protein [Acidimicrobiales bacterium]